MGEAKIKSDKKREQFEQNPDDFIHISEVKFALLVKEAEPGKAPVLSFVDNADDMAEAFQLQGVLNAEIIRKYIQIKMIEQHKKAMEQRSGLIVPGRK